MTLLDHVSSCFKAIIGTGLTINGGGLCNTFPNHKHFITNTHQQCNLVPHPSFPKPIPNLDNTLFQAALALQTRHYLPTKSQKVYNKDKNHDQNNQIKTYCRKKTTLR